MQNSEIIQKLKNKVHQHCEANEKYIEGGEFNELFFLSDVGYDINFTVNYIYSPGDHDTPDYQHMDVIVNYIEMIH